MLTFGVSLYILCTIVKNVTAYISCNIYMYLVMCILLLFHIRMCIGYRALVEEDMVTQQQQRSRMGDLLLVKSFPVEVWLPSKFLEKIIIGKKEIDRETS